VATLEELTVEVLRFRDERAWQQFHHPKNLAISVAVEAAELLELVQWREGDELQAHLREKQAEVGAELADILAYVLLLAHELDIDLGAAFTAKMAANRAKYPPEAARGIDEVDAIRARFRQPPPEAETPADE
jgi:dCTP diphosphatase